MTAAPSTVAFNSPEYAAYHEAGHIAAALFAGARVEKVCLYRDNLRTWGRTRVERTPMQAPRIAVGGFAVEYRLYRDGRLANVAGGTPLEKEFINYAIDNADDDRVRFFGGDYRTADGRWPADMDRRFMNVAIRYAEREMEFDVVESIAEALLARNTLSGDDIQLLVSAVVAKRSAAPDVDGDSSDVSPGNL